MSGFASGSGGVRPGCSERVPTDGSPSNTTPVPGLRPRNLADPPSHQPRRPGVFPELARKPAFAGLPGVFADALPDQFGNAVIRRYFEARGQPDNALSPLQRLLYIGDRAMGALEFRPPLDPGPATEEALEVRELVDQARRVIEGDVSVAVPEIMQVGGSAGARGRRH